MSKLTTKELKKMISGWLDNPSYRKFLEDYTELRGRHYLSPEDEIEYIRKMFGAPKNINTVKLLEEYIWNLWKDGNKYSREEKHKLGCEFETYFCDDEFFIDLIGGYDNDLVKQISSNKSIAEKCILRVFVPNNQLGDNFRLEVVTTPEDDKVVGWTVIVD